MAGAKLPIEYFSFCDFLKLLLLFQKFQFLCYRQQSNQKNYFLAQYFYRHFQQAFFGYLRR